MQMAVLPPSVCALVPHSTRPVWHQWESVQQQPKKSARRRLFQEEPDEEGNKQYVQRLLAELAERYKQKWNFDFDNDKPMEGKFQYEAVPAAQVPGFYRATHQFGQSFVGVPAPFERPTVERNENHWSPEEAEKSGNSKSSEFGNDQPMDDEAQTAAGPLKSPSRMLRKPRRNTNQTPKRNSVGAWPPMTTDGTQSKMTDFVTTRKGLPRSASKDCKEQSVVVPDCSPMKRRRHSLVTELSKLDSPIKKSNNNGLQTRRSQRLFARVALFE